MKELDTVRPDREDLVFLGPLSADRILGILFFLFFPPFFPILGEWDLGEMGLTFLRYGHGLKSSNRKVRFKWNIKYGLVLNYYYHPRPSVPRAKDFNERRK